VCGVEGPRTPSFQLPGFTGELIAVSKERLSYRCQVDSGEESVMTLSASGRHKVEEHMLRLLESINPMEKFVLIQRVMTLSTIAEN
jgi:hypothetical protein